jgi:hypothetical protein
VLLVTLLATLSISLLSRFSDALAFFWFMGTPLFAFPSSILATPVPGMALEGCFLLVPSLGCRPLLWMVVVLLRITILLSAFIRILLAATVALLVSFEGNLLVEALDC